MPRLYLKDRQGEKVFDLLEDTLTIGRSNESDLPVKDAGLSRHHCDIVRKEDGFWIKDLGSRNGTRVNGKKIKNHRLVQGDVIKLGKTEIRYELLSSEALDSAKSSKDGRKKYSRQKASVSPASKFSGARIDEKEKDTTQSTIDDDDSEEGSGPITNIFGAVPDMEDDDDEEEESSGAITKMFGAVLPDASKDEEKDEEEDKKKSAGPVTMMMERGEVDLSTEVNDSTSYTPVQSNKKKETDFGKKSSRAVPHHLSGKKKGTRKSPAAPSSNRKKKTKHKKHTHSTSVKKNASAMKGMLNLAMSLILIFGGIWFFFPKLFKSFSKGFKSKNTLSVQEKKRTSRQREKMVTLTLPSARENSTRRAENLLPKQKLKRRLTNKNGSTGKERNLQTPKEEPSGITMPSPQELEESLKTDQRKNVVKKRSLNSTRRVEGYDFLSDMMTEVAEMTRNESEPLSESDLRRLKVVRQMLRELNLKEASNELSRFEKNSIESNSLARQLEWLSKLFKRLNYFLSAGKVKFLLSKVISKAKFDGPISGFNSSGILVSSKNKGKKLVRWNELRSKEKYKLINLFLKKKVAEDYVALGVLCLTQDLLNQARIEFNRAEKKGFTDIQYYRDILEKRTATK